MSQALSKKNAHIVLILFDIAALAAIYWVYHYYCDIYELIEKQGSGIELESSLFYIILLLIMPVIHLLSVVNSIGFKKKHVFERYMAWLIGAAAVGLISGRYVIQYKIETDLKNSGYVLCDRFVKGRFQSEIYQFSKCDE